MTDQIILRGLRVFAHHGVFEHERQNGQDFLIDLVLTVPLRHAGITDNLADTVDYGDLAMRVVAAVSTDPVNLIETLAERIAQVALADARVEAVQVSVHKPQAPIPHEFADVVVSIYRDRAGADLGR